MDAMKALRVLEARPDVHVVVTDVEMPPGPTGIELARQICERCPYIQVIVSSGRMRPGLHEVPGCVAFLPKPWTADGLARLVQEAVDRATAGGNSQA